jgi:glycosyltransferase involved in cell wall biosynthesis
VARLAPGKGVDTVLEAVARVRERVPLRLIVVGDGPERAACEALADGLGVARAVSFVGARSAPLPLVAAADVFVFGSVSETMPFALLEAMALGVPVVSTAYAGGWAELLRPGENSLVAPPGDVAALADCIVRVLEEPGLAGRLTAGAGDDVARRSADAMASSYASVLREVAAG